MPDELRKPDACPSCSGTEIRLILYGLPSDETLQRAQRDEIVLGGCTIWDEMPDWRCMTCAHEWFDPTDPVRIEWDEFMAESEREHREKIRKHREV